MEQAKVAAAQAKTAAERHEEQTKADFERRITESFAKAVEQLGSEKLETRLGAIYTLERLSRESEREHWPIMETLTAYVREHAPWSPREQSPGSDRPADEKIWPETDVQVILTVLGRREKRMRDQEGEDQRLDLSETDLRGAKLVKVHFGRAGLWGAHLEHADFNEAHLERADLWGAHLEHVWLGRAHLEDANLRRAHLEGANLSEAHLEDANLRRAHLEGANLSEAHLKGANLRRAHLEGANLSETHLEGADLSEAHLEGANLNKANLTVANLGSAHLEGARLKGAHLEGAKLTLTHLGGANLLGAHLEPAKDLAQEQINSAFGNESTILPEGLKRPAHWTKQ